MLTADHIRKLAPRALPGYVEAFTNADGQATIAKYEIADSMLRYAGFLANAMSETGGATIVRESMYYTSTNRLRQVWPSRFRDKPESYLQGLCRNEEGLASVVYNGRMGNRIGTNDGYVYRGWGILQCTGRESIIRYCKLAGVDPEADPSVLGDLNISLLVACAEWQEGGCNELMDAGNFDGCCAVINVGDARRVGSVVGLADRRAWFGKVKSLFQNDQTILEEPISAAVDYDPTIHDDGPHWAEPATS